MEEKPMVKIIWVMAAIMLVFFASAGVSAGEEQGKPLDDKAFGQSTEPTPPHCGYQENPVERAPGDAKWLGKEVRNLEGEKLGTVKEFFQEPEGEISFVIISYKDFMGVGEEKVAVPYSMLSYDEKTGHFMTDLSKYRLEGAPRFENEVNLRDRSTAEEIYRYFGERPHWAQ
jgi:hypothetical protein